MEPVDFLSCEVLRLLGEVRGKRALELGMANDCLSTKLVAQGASPLLIDESADKLARLRTSDEFNELRFEVRQSKLADLAFCPAESIDLAASVIALAGTGDLARVFRQIQRVLKDQGVLVFGLVHPVAFLKNQGVAGKPISYRQKEPVDRAELNFTFPVPLPEKIRPISFGEAFSQLKRAGLWVDQLLEVSETGSEEIDDPTVLVIKARK